MIRPEDWERMSWHARQKAQHRALMYRRSKADVIEQLESPVLPPEEPLPVLRARVFKDGGVWHFQRGGLRVPCSSWDEAVDYLMSFGGMLERAA